MSDNISKPNKGLHQDNSYLEQPKETARFALNAVSETLEGDNTFTSNEKGNEACYVLTANYVPLGQVYIGNGETVIFSVSNDETLSEIGIADKNCLYTVLVNANLGFTRNNQIDASFRLRRGCERIIYFVSPKPQYYNIDKPNDFKVGGTVTPSKFDLFRRYDLIPIVDSITVENGGNLIPGSYNFSIQLLDENLNPTEWITTTETIIIYNDNTDKNFSEVRGSTSVELSYQIFGKTSKAIKLTLSNLDDNYPFYRIAIIESNNGNGQINAVKFSQEISISSNTFTYDGNNFQSDGIIEEIQAFETIIEKAEHIEQIENRLILANTKGKEINYCDLQSYASKIKADVIYKTIILDKVSESNPKSPTMHFDGIGYMPGEIYSFGIVYIFKDKTTSPVYHIPGRNTLDTSTMSDDNALTNTTYTELGSCNGNSYWGKDNYGSNLLGQPVRHHRFPLRSDVSKSLITENTVSGGGTTLYNISIVLSGSFTDQDAYSTSYGDVYQYTIDYFIGAIPYQINWEFNVSTYDSFVGHLQTFTINSTVIPTGLVFTEINAPSGLTLPPTLDTPSNVSSITTKQFTTDIFGIDFSEITKPPIEATNGIEVIGYYIVRNERTRSNKTILDSAVLSPLLQEAYYIGHGQIMPNLTDSTKIHDQFFSLIHPEHKFLGNEYQDVTELIKEGEFTLTSSELSNVITQDVAIGTSYDPAVHKEADSDGFDLQTLVRNNIVSYLGVAKDVIAGTGSSPAKTVDSVFYLDALDSRLVDDGSAKEIYNISADNKIGIIKLNSALTTGTKVDRLFGDKTTDTKKQLPYVILKKNLPNPYSNFRTLPYYKEIANPVLFVDVDDSNVEIFNGDVYTSSMRYTSTVFNDIKLKRRDTKSGIFNIILGVLAVIAGVTLIIGGIFTAGASVPAGLMAIGFGMSKVATGIKQENIGKVYKELYDQGLKTTAQDIDTDSKFNYTVADDEIQWFSDVVTNLWFESTVNMGTRFGATASYIDFLDSPGQSITTLSNYAKASNNKLDSHLINKLTVMDTDNENGRLYQGFPNAELYQINPDYLRRNKEKIYFHLALEYDCCSDCTETFPHRVHYSEQAFQEELTDNYFKFLPNNYRDIEGEKGVITNVFRLQNNLFIHTEEALWQLPQDIQERVTGDIISFLGTGSFFSVPPRKIVDDSKSSAGSRYKWATLKTKHGVFFVSDEDRKIYQFNGNALTPISDSGLSTWFKNNMNFKVDSDYFSSNQRTYPHLNNTSNLLGAGFIAVYDTRNERVIFTKKDFTLHADLLGNSDYEITTKNTAAYSTDLYRFDAFNATIAAKLALGFDYKGIEGGNMKFYNTSTEVTDLVAAIPTTTANVVGDNASWTISYSLKDNTWTSWHSYLPDFYFYVQERFFSLKSSSNQVWEHNKGLYQRFYGTLFPHIIEYVSNSNPLVNSVTDHILLKTSAESFDAVNEEYLEERFKTFNKMLVYNSRQISGLIDLVVKDNDNVDYLENQTVDSALNQIVIDKNEGYWTVNNLRDYRDDYTIAMFKKDLSSLQTNYFIDKEVNDSAINLAKDWTELESFRDKYLVIRLIFDNFDNIRLITNYSIENERPSIR